MPGTAQTGLSTGFRWSPPDPKAPVPGRAGFCSYRRETNEGPNRGIAGRTTYRDHPATDESPLRGVAGRPMYRTRAIRRPLRPISGQRQPFPGRSGPRRRSRGASDAFLLACSGLPCPEAVVRVHQRKPTSGPVWAHSSPVAGSRLITDRPELLRCNGFRHSNRGVRYSATLFRRGRGRLPRAPIVGM